MKLGRPPNSRKKKLKVGTQPTLLGLRMLTGLTQREMALRIHSTARSVREWERTNSIVSTSMRLRIMGALDPNHFFPYLWRRPLKSIRHRAGLSREKIAEELDILLSTVETMERNNYIPDEELYKKFRETCVRYYVPRNLGEWRRKTSFSNRQIAKLLGVSIHVYRYWERSMRRIPKRDYERVEAIMRLSEREVKPLLEVMEHR